MTYNDWTNDQVKTTVTVDSHDLSVAYHEDGVENSGATVVFIHGIPTLSFLWRNVVTPLADFRHVLAPDLLG